MKLQDVCALDVACCTRDTTITTAAKLMREQHVGDLIVIEGYSERSPIGIVTDRDIVVEVLATGRDPSTTTVGDIMNSNVVVADESEDVSVALERMKMHGVRRLPIVGHEENITGVVSLDDLVKVHAQEAAALADVITKEQNREARARR
ncbi:MAG TPA: CBS domain-containing protein [Steroidobacteraceae bacterium]|nr:CBS domain-containing protein [Steroidobacteraceae bacterium]